MKTILQSNFLGMLSTVPGIIHAKVDLGGKEGRMQYLPDKIKPKDIAEQVDDMGFEAFVKSVNGREVKRGGF